ncbi:glycoside hydrolase family 1 protein [Shouchella patagoniensis]|uniref:glycoside hydrolase family 1 protein n=1 Tax=Shouchella patagoniensis TaxID=228576 RepID=UPI000995D0EB|nr:glycoside hydrolase family 1 protein [Shouchella patagoniensis]
MEHKQNETFSSDFLWGAATSSFQVEGAQNEGGKGLSVIDVMKKNPKITDFSVAIDHYHRYKEDVKLMADLGLKVYRFSIAWTRIFPKGNGEVNEEGVAFYNDLINELVSYNIEPLITIYHFDYPQDLVEQYGGWMSRKSIEDYRAYAEFLFKTFGDRVKYWLTINEQDHVVRIPSRLGLTGDDRYEQMRLGYQANHNMCVATALTIKTFHELGMKGKIGPAVSYSMVHPASAHPDDHLASKDAMLIKHNYLLDLHCRGEYSKPFQTYLADRNYMPQIEDGDLDLMKQYPPTMIGVNYYFSETVTSFPATEEFPIGYQKEALLAEAEAGVFQVVKNDRLQATDWGWEIDPVGLRLTLRELNERYQLPIIITENGMGAYDELDEGDMVHDDYRIAYLNEHIKQVQLALNDGVDVFGYCAWTFIDVVSGRNGMDKRYGFVYVDRENFDLKEMRRIKKKSYYWYQSMIESNGKRLT